MPPGDEAGWLRRAVGRAYAVLREQDPVRQRQLIRTDMLELLAASAVRAYEVTAHRKWRLVPDGEVTPVPEWAARMEAELLPRALAAKKSLLSSHPRLDPTLAELARHCSAEGITTHLLLVRAHEETHGAYGVHWFGHDRPRYEQRVGFYYYWDTIGIAAAATNERLRVEAELARLRRHAFWDKLTGLPNAQALEDELHRHAETQPLSVIALDFDGMREANAGFGFAEGGDVLIRAVGQGLATLTHTGEFAARMHTAGDEFAVLLPGVGEEAAQVRAAEIESGLDALDVPETHQPIYRGASVGFATRRESETPGQVLGRAIETMRLRKNTRRSQQN